MAGEQAIDAHDIVFNFPDNLTPTDAAPYLYSSQTAACMVTNSTEGAPTGQILGIDISDPANPTQKWAYPIDHNDVGWDNIGSVCGILPLPGTTTALIYINVQDSPYFIYTWMIILDMETGAYVEACNPFDQFTAPPTLVEFEVDSSTYTGVVVHSDINIYVWFPSCLGGPPNNVGDFSQLDTGFISVGSSKDTYKILYLGGSVSVNDQSAAEIGCQVLDTTTDNWYFAQTALKRSDGKLVHVSGSRRSTLLDGYSDCNGVECFGAFYVSGTAKDTTTDQGLRVFEFYKTPFYLYIYTNLSVVHGPATLKVSDDNQFISACVIEGGSAVLVPEVSNFVQHNPVEAKIDFPTGPAIPVDDTFLRFAIPGNAPESALSNSNYYIVLFDADGGAPTIAFQGEYSDGFPPKVTGNMIGMPTVGSGFFAANYQATADASHYMRLRPLNYL